MKKNKNVLSLLCGIFFFGCISCAIGGDRVVKVYVVEINGVKMCNGGATNLLYRILEVDRGRLIQTIDEHTGKNVDIATIMEAKPGTNITITNSVLVEKVLRLFRKCRDKQNIAEENIKIIRSDDSELCVFEKDTGINLCIDNSNRITRLAFL
jgi:hypothetical protein